jgi:cell division protein FtsA
VGETVVCLDIGTSFVRALIGENTDSDACQILGIGVSPNTGVRNGLVVNIEDTAQAIKEAVGAAEVVSGCEAAECTVAIGGAQIAGINSKGLVAITGGGQHQDVKGGGREITLHDQQRVIETAKAMKLPPDRQVLHVIPQSYIVDGNGGIKSPVNMLGVRLEATVHIITAAITPLENIRRCVTRSGYTLGKGSVMLKTLAAAQSVLTEEELQLGSILLDLGGGTTDALVLYDGAPICTVSVPYGGKAVTSDIVLEKGVAFDTAETIKVKAGCCWETFIGEGRDVIIPGLGGRAPTAITCTELYHIIRARVEENLLQVKQAIVKNSNVNVLLGNIVLVGGGALMNGIVDLTKEVFSTEAVRVGYPGNLGSVVDEYRTPEWAAATGLLISTLSQHRESDQGGSRPANRQNHSIGEWLFKRFHEFF